MKLTIIIPVYKVEAYLDFCLKSIARQNVEDYEVILVDDGSPDRSGALCDAWVRKDGRFRVIHCPENRGLSAARNRGLDEAHGEYVTFVDSDDYISPHTLQANMELLALHPEADVLEYPVCVYHGTAKAYRYTPGTCEITDYTGWAHRKGYIHSYAWNKIYKRSLWKSLRFPEGRWYEDVFTIPAVLRQARYILRSDKGLYYYCSRQGSISNTLQRYSRVFTRASMTFSRPTSRYIAHCPTIQTLTTRIWTMLTYTCATIRSYEYNSVVPCASPNAKYHCAAPCSPVAR